MELNLARLVYDQADPAVKDIRPTNHLQQISVSIPDRLATPGNPNLSAVEDAMKQEGFMVQVVV